MRLWLLAVLFLPSVVLTNSAWSLEVAPVAAAKRKAVPLPSPPAEAPAPPDLKAPPLTPAEALRGDIDRILADAAAAHMTVAARIIVLGDEAGRAPEVVYSVRADHPLIPASTMKLVTTAACLDRFGADWRIRTHVGRIPAAGKDAPWDLAVIGGGDPNFSGRFYDEDSVGAFRRWAAVLKSRGIKALGRLVLDDTLFDDTIQHPQWPADQRAEWYEAPVSALGLNDNCIDVRLSPGQVGGPAVIRLDPPGDYASIEGSILTVADRKDHVYTLARLPAPGAATGMRLRVGGGFWVQSPEVVEYRTVASPTMFFGAALAETLRSEGIAVAGPVVRERLVDKDGRARPDFACDIVHVSRLDVTITVANKRSQGLYAECLMKILGAYAPTPKVEAPLPPRQGTWETGTEEARRWLVERGIPADGCVIVDGSGLAKENRLTALAVAELLRVMCERHGDAFLHTLAAAGEDGSLSKRMRNTPAEGRVWGKTGYVLGVSALSGYVRSKGGRTIAYSIMMNDVPWGQLWRARDAQDKVCLRLVEY